MKKLFLALLAVASVGTANAQKNTFLLYGNAGVTYGQNDNGAAGIEKNTMWNVTPGFGYQFNNHLTVGIQGGYNEFKATNDMKGVPAIKSTNRDREWQLGAFFRYTQPLGGIFAMYTQLDLSYLDGYNESETITTPPVGGSLVVSSNDRYNGFQGMITPAIAIYVHKGLALNFAIGGLGYRMASYDKAPLDMSTFNVTFGNQLNIGISKNIGCHCGRGRAHHEPGMEHRKMKKHNDDEDDE